MLSANITQVNGTHLKLVMADMYGKMGILLKAVLWMMPEKAKELTNGIMAKKLAVYGEIINLMETLLIFVTTKSIIFIWLMAQS